MSEAIHLFDPRKTMQLGGFSERAATTTLTSATETGFVISGIFQGAEDFAVLEWHNAYDFYNHLRFKPLPRTDLSGITLQFDIEVDHTLDGNTRLGCMLYPTIAWDSMIFYFGPTLDPWMVRLLDYATVLSGAETDATATMTFAGSGASGLLYLYFRENRYVVDTSTWVGGPTTLQVAQEFAAQINTGVAAHGSIYMGNGTDYGGAGLNWISASAGAGSLVVTFVGFGKDGSRDRLFTSSDWAGWAWTNGTEGAGVRFTGGDDTSVYRVVLPFNTMIGRQSPLDTGVVLHGVTTSAGMTDVRKITMAFTPRFENEEANLEGSGAVPLTPDTEWKVTVSNITLTGSSPALKVGGPGENDRLEESKNAIYTGYWETAPVGWWSGGYAKRTAPASSGDVRQVVVTYTKNGTHDLVVGTQFGENCGHLQVSVDGDTPTVHDLFLNTNPGNESNGMLLVRTGLTGGKHVVTLKALFAKNSASSGYYFYYDYLWPLVQQDIPDAPWTLFNVGLALDFDTDHGIKKPPFWVAWVLQKLGFLGRADVYMGVFWNNKRRRVNATYPSCAIAFTSVVPGDIITIHVGATLVQHAVGYGETPQSVCSAMRANLNAAFGTVWCDNAFNTSTTLTIKSRAPAWNFAVTVSVSGGSVVTKTAGSPDLNGTTMGADGDWQMLDTATPVMTQGARDWFQDLAAQLVAAGIPASWAFSMECYLPPAAMRAKFLHNSGGVVSPGSDVYLSSVPDYQMHFGSQVQAYMAAMYLEAAAQIAAGGMSPIVLQFGETQWWYDDDKHTPNMSETAVDASGGMPYYDASTIADFLAAKGHQIWPFVSNTDNPSGDPSHAHETADFLKARIWAYCSYVMAAVQAVYPAAQFEVLWPRDANQGPGVGLTGYRQLNDYVNLPDQWKTNASGIAYFRVEGYDYDVVQHNIAQAMVTALYPYSVLGRPVGQCAFLQGIYVPGAPVQTEFWAWRKSVLGVGTGSLALWALDQFCLMSIPVPIPRTQIDPNEIRKFHHFRYGRVSKRFTV